MIFSNINLGSNVEIDPSTNINNVFIGNNTRIAKYCSIYGSSETPLIIGECSYVGMFSIINGYSAAIKIGNNVSIAQNVNIMSDSGPNASQKMQKIFSTKKGIVEVGCHCWIGASAIIMPGVILGNFCVVAAGSFVNKSFPSYSIIGGTPARLIRRLNDVEIGCLNEKS